MTVAEKEIPAQQEILVQQDIPAKESARTKTTINLGNILKPQQKAEATPEEKNGSTLRKDEPVIESKLRDVWSQYAELRKNQVAEYHLLNQSFTFKNNIVTVQLTNPVEEPLLAGMRLDLVNYLREKLGNSKLQVESEMQQTSTKKKAYTNKEKFEYLAEKNPLLKNLQERLGLDPEF
jgi:hypothetical protein